MLAILIILIILTLILKIRLKLQLDNKIKTAFFGLGQSGVTYDFISKHASIQFFGKQFKEFSKQEQRKNKNKGTTKEINSEKKADKPKRVRPIKDILALIPKSSNALYNYSISLLKSVIIEELDGQVTAGFDSPDITGQVYGYYQAAYYAVPSVVGRLHYQPNWTEASFDANLRASVAIPLYKIIYRSIILFFSLPLRDIIKITIGRKERSHDG